MAIDAGHRAVRIDGELDVLDFARYQGRHEHIPWTMFAPFFFELAVAVDRKSAPVSVVEVAGVALDGRMIGADVDIGASAHLSEQRGRDQIRALERLALPGIEIILRSHGRSRRSNSGFEFYVRRRSTHSGNWAGPLPPASSAATRLVCQRHQDDAQALRWSTS